VYLLLEIPYIGENPVSLFLKPGIEEKKYLFLEKKNND